MNWLLKRCQRFASAQWRRFSAGCLWSRATWTATLPTPFSTSTGLEFQGKLLLIQGPAAVQEAGCSKSTSGCGCMEGPFCVRSLWSKKRVEVVWNCKRNKYRNPGHEALRRKRWRWPPLNSNWIALNQCWLGFGLGMGGVEGFNQRCRCAGGGCCGGGCSPGRQYGGVLRRELAEWFYAAHVLWSVPEIQPQSLAHLSEVLPKSSVSICPSAVLAWSHTRCV